MGSILEKLTISSHQNYYSMCYLSFVDIKELKVLVDLAMISASGQGSMEEEKVSCLHSAVTGYASLIYDLKEKDGYGLKEFLAKCQPVWSAVESDPRLPNKLVGILCYLVVTCFRDTRDN